MQKRLLIVAAVLTCALATQPVLAKSKSPLTFVQTLEKSGVPANAAAKAMSLTTQNSFVAAVESFGATPDLLNAFLGLWLPALTGDGVVAQRDIVAFNNRADLSLTQRTHARAFTQLMQNSPALATRAVATDSSATGSAASSGGAQLSAGAIGGIAAAAAVVVAVAVGLVMKSRNKKANTPNGGGGTVSNLPMPTPGPGLPTPVPPVTEMTAERRAEARLRVEAVKEAVGKHAPVVSKAVANHLLTGGDLAFDADMLEALGGKEWVVKQVKEAKDKKLAIDIEAFKALTPAQQEFVLAVRAIDFEAIAARVRKLHINGYIEMVPGAGDDAEPTKTLRKGFFHALQALHKDGVMQDGAFGEDGAIDALVGVDGDDKAAAKAKRNALVAGIAGLVAKRTAREEARNNFFTAGVGDGDADRGLKVEIAAVVGKQFTDTNAVRNTAGDADLNIIIGELPEGENVDADLALIFKTLNAEQAKLDPLSVALDAVMNVVNPDGLLDGDLVSDKGSRNERAKRAQQDDDVVPQIRDAKAQLAARKEVLDARKNEVAAHSAPLMGKLWLEKDAQRTNALASVTTFEDLMKLSFVALTEGATLQGDVDDAKVEECHAAFNKEFMDRIRAIGKASHKSFKTDTAKAASLADLIAQAAKIDALFILPDDINAHLTNPENTEEFVDVSAGLGSGRSLDEAKKEEIDKLVVLVVARAAALRKAQADAICASIVDAGTYANLCGLDITLPAVPEALDTCLKDGTGNAVVITGKDEWKDAEKIDVRSADAAVQKDLATILRQAKQKIWGAEEASRYEAALNKATAKTIGDVTLTERPEGLYDTDNLQEDFDTAKAVRIAVLATQYRADAAELAASLATMSAEDLAGVVFVAPHTVLGLVEGDDANPGTVAELRKAFNNAVEARKAKLADEAAEAKAAEFTTFKQAAEGRAAALKTMTAVQLADQAFTAPGGDHGFDDAALAELEEAFNEAKAARQMTCWTADCRGAVGKLGEASQLAALTLEKVGLVGAPSEAQSAALGEALAAAKVAQAQELIGQLINKLTVTNLDNSQTEFAALEEVVGKDNLTADRTDFNAAQARLADKEAAEKAAAALQGKVDAEAAGYTEAVAAMDIDALVGAGFVPERVAEGANHAKVEQLKAAYEAARLARAKALATGLRDGLTFANKGERRADLAKLEEHFNVTEQKAAFDLAAAELPIPQPLPQPPAPPAPPRVSTPTPAVPLSPGLPLGDAAAADGDVRAAQEAVIAAGLGGLAKVTEVVAAQVQALNVSGKLGDGTAICGAIDCVLMGTENALLSAPTEAALDAIDTSSMTIEAVQALYVAAGNATASAETYVTGLVKKRQKRQQEFARMVTLLNGEWADSDAEELEKLFLSPDAQDADAAKLAEKEALWALDADGTLLGNLSDIPNARISAADCTVGLDKVNAAIAGAKAGLEKLKKPAAPSPEFDASLDADHIDAFAVLKQHGPQFYMKDAGTSTDAGKVHTTFLYLDGVVNKVADLVVPVQGKSTFTIPQAKVRRDLLGPVIESLKEPLAAYKARLAELKAAAPPAITRALPTDGGADLVAAYTATNPLKGKSHRTQRMENLPFNLAAYITACSKASLSLWNTEGKKWPRTDFGDDAPTIINDKGINARNDLANLVVWVAQRAARGANKK